ncbi:hypothetical protein JGZ66_01725 [Shigella sonnei]|nr:hypothetical protein JGZ66_01725 [Shigella sonnei]
MSAVLTAEQALKLVGEKKPMLGPLVRLLLVRILNPAATGLFAFPHSWPLKISQ